MPPTPSTRARTIAVSTLGHSTQDTVELAEFLDVLLEKPPQTILEIGVAFAGSLQAWLQVAPVGSLVVGVDANLDAAHYDAPAGTSVILLQGRSQDAETIRAVEKALGGFKVDFLFIDGEHTTEAAFADYRNYAPLVRSGGLIAFHDAAGNNPVKEAIAALGLKLNLIHNSAETKHCMGIGWMRKP